jgi:YVTN family beta-propeller protein
VTNTFNSTISVINATTNTVDDTINATRGLPLSSLPVGIAAGFSQTLYVALYGTDRIASINSVTNTVDDSAAINLSPDPWSVAVLGSGTTDDTIFIADERSSVSVFDAAGLVEEPRIDLFTADDSEPQIAISESNILYVTNEGSGQLSVIDGATQTLDDTLTLGGAPSGVATAGTTTVYVTNKDDSAVWVVNATTKSVDDTIAVGGSPKGLVYDPKFKRLYVGNTDDSTVSVINTLTNTVDATITGVSHPEALTISPDGSRVYVTSAFVGVDGFVTVISVTAPTPPAPAMPPGAPTDVNAEAGDARATVSWTAPTSVGSFPISDYQVLSSPDARTCLVASPATTCEVTGLTNGTAYTFTVRALNGAGWGSYSTPSAPVTPNAEAKKSIQIIGSRDASDTRRVVVNGVTTGLVGAQVRPFIRFPGQSGYSPGTGVRTVAEDGTFTWQRRAGKKIYVYFTSGDVRSERVIIAAR